MKSTAKVDIASRIDHTILHGDTTLAQVKKLCKEALDNGFAAVCVPPLYVQDAFKMLEETKVKIATVVGFPLGYSPTSAKVEEAKAAFTAGADEVDMVLNVAAFKSDRMSYVKNDIQSVVTAAHIHGKIVKVIIETALLTEKEIIKACELCASVEADFVKTSTGFAGAGATVEHVKLIRSVLPQQVKIKASGGIKTREFALELIDAGADRLGTSSGTKLLL